MTHNEKHVVALTFDADTATILMKRGYAGAETEHTFSVEKMPDVLRALSNAIDAPPEVETQLRLLQVAPGDHVRFCPACGSVSAPNYRGGVNCCPDKGQAAIVHVETARMALTTFLRERNGDPAVAPEGEPAPQKEKWTIPYLEVHATVRTLVSRHGVEARSSNGVSLTFYPSHGEVYEREPHRDYDDGDPVFHVSSSSVTVHGVTEDCADAVRSYLQSIV